VEQLTVREVEVLRLACEGYTDREIARVLKVGRGTVRTHAQHIREKLGARSRTEAAARALMLGLL
jgi:DNA-binding NarL/FixJ family response regulator